MQPGLPMEYNKKPSNEKMRVPCMPSSPMRGLKRMEGISQLKPILPMGLENPVSSASMLLSHSTSMVNVNMNLKPSEDPFAFMGFSKNDDKQLSSKPSGLKRTKTSMLPIKINNGPNHTGLQQNDNRKVTPIRLKVERTPGGTITKASIVPKPPAFQSAAFVFPKNSDTQEQVTPPNLRRTSSGSMLLRQTPERVRRLEENISPVKRRSGTAPKLLTEEKEDNIELYKCDSMTPALKRTRTSSLIERFPSVYARESLYQPDMAPLLTPQRLRPRRLSNSRAEDINRSPVKKLVSSPVKKRACQASGSGQSSPQKSQYVSSVSIEFEEDTNDTRNTTLMTPIKNAKSPLFYRNDATKRIAKTYGIDKNRMDPTTSSFRFAPPQLVTRSTSGNSYYSATEGEEFQEEVPSHYNEGSVSISNDLQCSQQSDQKMVPLVKKQISVDEKVLGDEEDEGFGDSTKTIKRGQGGALARSLSLKLSPRNDQQTPLGLNAEKSCSTPSLPTKPLLRQGSTSSLRFKVSPSKFLKPLVSSTVIIPPPIVLQMPAVTDVEPAEPSTSKTSEDAVKQATKKSSMKKQSDIFTVRDNGFIQGFRPKKVKFTGVNVHYFDRRQGKSTVPTEGDVALDMHNEHHSHRYFSLSSGKRPLLDLSLYEDDELSDGEVIDPDSDDGREYDDYASAKSILRINQRHRIKLLKKSGVVVEKNAEAIEDLRVMRVDCGCSCENGVCLPDTCQCAIDGIHCQVDGGDYPTKPCSCFAETCTNPEGRTFYDSEAVHQFRLRTIMNWRAAQKVGVVGSPVVKTFKDSDDEEEEKSKAWLLNNAIPIKLEDPLTKYPTTPVYTRRSRSSLSDIRESSSEACSINLTTSLSERMRAMQHLDNEVCVEEKDDEEEVEKETTIIEADVTLHEVYVSQDTSDAECLETAMSPAKTTLVV